MPLIGPIKPPGPITIPGPTPKPTPSPRPGPAPAPYNPNRANDAWSNSWIARGKFEMERLKTIPDVPKVTPTPEDKVKTANTSTFEQTVFDSLPDYSVDERLSLIGLTANEILEVSHRQNFYTNGAVLNDNILNLVDTVSAFSPTEIIKLQVPNLGYFQNNLSSYNVSLPEMSAIVTISIPNDKANSAYKVEVENFAPKYIKNDTIYE